MQYNIHSQWFNVYSNAFHLQLFNFDYTIGPMLN